MLGYLYVVCRDDYETARPVIAAYLVAILKECSLYYERIRVSPEPLTAPERISRQFIGLVNKHYLQKRRLSDYAELFSISPKHLSKSI